MLGILAKDVDLPRTDSGQGGGGFGEHRSRRSAPSDQLRQKKRLTRL